MQDVTMALRGNIPVILTVPHDGRLTEFENEEFPIKKPKRQNDEGTFYVALKIYEDMFARFQKKPFVLFQKVERRRLTRCIRRDFYYRVLEDVRFCLDRWSRCYFIDIHAFANQLAIGNYDVVLGTNHRQTVYREFDRRFGLALGSRLFFDSNGSKCRLKVYVPDVRPKKGEKFCATKNFTLVRWIKNRESRVSALQMEIYKDWLMINQDTENLIKVLSSTIALTAV